MKSMIAALFACSFFLGACDEPDAGLEFRETCDPAAWADEMWGPGYSPVAPTADTEAMICEMQHECNKQDIKPECTEFDGGAIVCTCGGIICRADATMTYTCV